MAGCAFSNAFAGMIHELGKAAGEAWGIAHGLCMGILLPYIMEKQVSLPGYHIADLQLPLAGFDVYAGTAEAMRARKAINLLHDLQDDLFKVSGGAIPRALKDLNISKDLLKDINRKAVGEGLKGFSAEDHQAILEKAWEGR